MHTSQIESEERHYDGTSLRIARLVAICHRSEQVCGQAIQSATRNEFRECVGKIRELLAGFGFQLRIELQNLDRDNSGAFPVQGAYAMDYNDCETSLCQVLDIYLRALDGHLPPHTRAMVKRQYDQLQAIFEEFNQFVSVLQGLIAVRVGLPN